MDDNPFERHSKQQRAKILTIAIPIVLVVGGYLYWSHVQDREAAEWESFKRRRDGIREAKEKPRLDAIKDALRGVIVPRPDLGRCEVELKDVPMASLADVNELSFASSHGALNMKTPTPAQSEAALAAWAKTLDAWDKELNIVTESVRAELFRIEDRPYVRDEYLVHTYVYSYREKRILCASSQRAHVDAGPKTTVVTDAGLEISYTSSDVELSVVGPP